MSPTVCLRGSGKHWTQLRSHPRRKLSLSQTCPPIRCSTKIPIIQSIPIPSPSTTQGLVHDIPKFCLSQVSPTPNTALELGVCHTPEDQDPGRGHSQPKGLGSSWAIESALHQFQSCRFTAEASSPPWEGDKPCPCNVHTLPGADQAPLGGASGQPRSPGPSPQVLWEAVNLTGRSNTSWHCGFLLL